MAVLLEWRVTADSGSLAERIERLESLAQIRQLPARYGAAFARYDFDALVSLFVADVRVGRDTYGRDALRRQLRDSMRAGEPTAIKISILHVGNHAIDFDGSDDARGEVYCHGEMMRADGSWFHQAIHYGDTYRREADGQWRFVRRRHQLFYGAPPGVRPVGLAPANWPAHDEGTGTLPYAWPSWPAYWTGSAAQ